jgi:hypothetical protein
MQYSIFYRTIILKKRSLSPRFLRISTGEINPTALS